MSANPHRGRETTLAGLARGVFRVWTESSVYLVSLNDDGHTLTRTPGEGLGAAPQVPGELAPPSDLRVDGDALELVSIERCVVGERAIFMVAMPAGVPVAPGYLGVTERTTTIVRGIESIGPRLIENNQTDG